MKVGDLVKRRAAWGELLVYNPWMEEEKDSEIGRLMKKLQEKR